MSLPTSTVPDEVTVPSNLSIPPLSALIVPLLRKGAAAVSVQAQDTPVGGLHRSLIDKAVGRIRIHVQVRPRYLRK